MPSLWIETDYDYALEYNGKVYDNDSTIYLNRAEQLRDIEILGAFGSPRTENTKCWEFETAVEEIQKNPNQTYRTFGNRGIHWNPAANSQDDFLDALHQLLEKHDAEIGFDVCESSDFYGIHNPRMEILIGGEIVETLIGDWSICKTSILGKTHD